MQESRISASTPPVACLVPVLLVGLAAALLFDFALQHSPMAVEIFNHSAAARVGAIAAVAAMTIAAAITVFRARRAELLRVRIDSGAITLTWSDTSMSVPRSGIGSIVACDDLIIRDPNGTELARCNSSLRFSDLDRCLALHGYPRPLRDDPNDADFAPFDEASVPVSRDVTRLLAVRAELIRLSDAAQAEALRRRIVRAGFNVRDHRKRGFRLRQEISPNALLPRR